MDIGTCWKQLCQPDMLSQQHWHLPEVSRGPDCRLLQSYFTLAVVFCDTRYGCVAFHTSIGVSDSLQVFLILRLKLLLVLFGGSCYDC